MSFFFFFLELTILASKVLSDKGVKVSVRDEKQLRNRSLGALLLALALLAMIGYFWLLFLAPPDIREWAIIIPVVIIVYGVLIVIAWIGWALASTAPPLPVTEENTED